MGYQFNLAGGSGTGTSGGVTFNGGGGTGVATANLSTGATLGNNFNATPALPSWLPTNDTSQTAELSSTFNTAPQSILNAANTSAGAMKKSANIDYDQNMRQAANASTQLANVNRQQGGTAKTSSIVAGQMAEGAQAQKTDARVQIAQMKQQATVQAASLSSQIATSLAQLRNSYLGTLAGVSTEERGQNMNYAEFADNALTNSTKLGTGSTPKLGYTGNSNGIPQYNVGVSNYGDAPTAGVPDSGPIPGNNPFGASYFGG